MSELTNDNNPEYWSQYSNLQHVKHALIRHYLNGWLPKLALGPSASNRLVYIDTHAGRGKHLNGQLGSPLVALTTLLGHRSRDRILENTEVRFYFIERDQQNAAALKKELEVHPLPKNVIVGAGSGSCFEIIDGAIQKSVKDGKQLAPSFVFVDPYGFKLPGDLLRRLLSFPKTELFVNVIWRELDMAITNARSGTQPGMVDTLNAVFDGDGWRKIEAADEDNRAEQCAEAFRQLTKARWGTYIRMLDKGRIRYFLLHLTKHEAGRDLMKECVWKACPDGGYYASKSDNPAQQLLIEMEPNLMPLTQWVVAKLSDGPMSWQDLRTFLRDELWLEKHLNQVIRSMRTSGEITADGYTGSFAASKNPRLCLARKKEANKLLFS